MNILFVVTHESLPSSIVRVKQYAEYLKKNEINYNIINFTSTISIALEKMQQPLMGGNNFIKKCARHGITAIIKIINRVHVKVISHRIIKSAQNYNAIFFQWILPPVSLIESINRAGIPIVYDIDDAVFLLEPEKAEKVMKKAWQVVAGSHFIYDYACRWNKNSVIVPSSVQIENFKGAQDVLTPGVQKLPVVIGWIGGPSTLKYLAILDEPLSELAAEGNDIELLIAGTWNSHGSVPKFEGLKVREIPFYSEADIPRLVDQIDIGVMPILNTPWEEGKCAMKALIYMAGARPTVCSNVGEALHIIRDGENGYLAKDQHDWKLKLKNLIDDSLLRNQIGFSGRETVKKNYSTEVCFNKLYNEVLVKIPSNNAMI